MKTVIHRNHELKPMIGSYAQGKGGDFPYIRLLTDYGEPYATCTAYLDGLKPGEVAIKDYSENEGILKALLEADIVTMPHRVIPSGYVVFPVCYLKEGENGY